jgi:hypothetical protein
MPRLMPEGHQPLLLDDAVHVLVGFLRTGEQGQEWMDDSPWLSPPQELDIPRDCTALMVADRFRGTVAFWDVNWVPAG